MGFPAATCTPLLHAFQQEANPTSPPRLSSSTDCDNISRCHRKSQDRECGRMSGPLLPAPVLNVIPHSCIFPQFRPTISTKGESMKRTSLFLVAFTLLVSLAMFGNTADAP